MSNRRESGQVALYLLLALVAIFILALLCVDTFLFTRAKTRLQDRGDAAALAAARRQGSIINEIGRLNIAHIKAALENDEEKCVEIEAEQRRLALIEPVLALAKADEAARLNGAKPREDFAAILDYHVKDIRSKYSGGGGEADPYPESYPGAWVDYASAIRDVAGGALAVGPDNIEFYYASASHLLLNRLFYNAIAGEDWCWFLFNCEKFLNNYSSYANWGALPSREDVAFENSEIFSLHLRAWKGALTEILTPEEIDILAKRYSLFPEKRIVEFLEGESLIDSKEQTWFFFDSNYWREWFDGRRLSGEEDGDEFPIVGKIKDEYNVRGCAAICRVSDSTESFSTDAAYTHTWCAAAKPFGYLEGFEGEIGPVTILKGFVVPCMQDARLVPVDSVGGANLATADWDWVMHVRNHVGEYLRRGPKSNGGCWYCAQLKIWEKKSFRERGKEWLKKNAGLCLRPMGGGNYHGGTSHGH